MRTARRDGFGTDKRVASYIPVDNYLAMLDEGRKYCVRDSN